MDDSKLIKVNRLLKISTICALIGFIPIVGILFFGIKTIFKYNWPQGDILLLVFLFIFSAFALVLGVITIIIGFKLDWGLLEAGKLLISFFMSILSILFLLQAFQHDSTCYNCTIRSNIDGARVAAEMWWDNPSGGNGTYNNVCNSPAFNNISTAIKAIAEKDVRCFSSEKEWCAEADLVNSKGEWCADSTGYAGSEANCSADNIKCQ